MGSSAMKQSEWINAFDEQGNAVQLRIHGPRRGQSTVVTLANGRHLLVRGRGVYQAVGDGMVYKCEEHDAP
ncbi:hypothetical protein [Lacipirellula sp.]|uniref:hypothetical protein n=1 Tax=Lacipirellula sp. TaxID=2691419 RepID=UPI003D0E876B